MKNILVGAFLSQKYIASLGSLGYNIIKLPPCSSLPEPVCDHPDMIMLYDKNRCELIMPRVYYNENEAFFQNLENTLGLKIVKEDIDLGNKYPCDVFYDALCVKNTVYGKEGFVSPEILKRHSRFVPVNQGYARCSTAVLGKECAVTSDMGIASALRGDGIDVLIIESGNIDLSGYGYGFIGGAGGALDDNTYCFFGDIKKHPEGEKIIRFAEKHKIKTVSLSDTVLSDNGSFIAF